MLPRSEFGELNRLLSVAQVVAVLGPRLCGKTTLARQTQHTTFFDLSTPETAAMLSSHSDALRRAKGLTVLDEIHNMPEILPAVARLAAAGQRFLLVGWATQAISSSIKQDIPLQLLRLLPLLGFKLSDVGVGSLQRLWMRGGLPASFLALDDPSSFDFRREYVATFVGADVHSYGGTIGKPSILRFLEYLSVRQGCPLSSSVVAAETGLSASIINRYVALLEQAYMVRVLLPFSAHLRSRALRKVYVRDSGLLHALLGISSWTERSNAKYQGLSWEGFALETVLGLMPGLARFGFHQDRDGSEVDLVAETGDRRWGFQFCLSADHARASERRGRRLLQEVEQLYFVHPGRERYTLGSGQEVVPLELLQAVIQSAACGQRARHTGRAAKTATRRNQPPDGVGADVAQGSLPEATAPDTPKAGTRVQEDVSMMKAVHTRSVEDLRGITEVGILTIRQDEFDAVVARLKNHQPVTGGKNSYEYSEVTTPQGLVRAVVTRAVDKASDEAQAIARNMIDDVEPRWILLVGIGGGMPDHEYTLGDVLLGSRLTDFSVTAALGGGRREYSVKGAPMRPDVNALLQTLSARTTQLGRWNSKRAVSAPRPQEVVPKTLTEHFGRRLYGSTDWRKKVHECLSEHFSRDAAPRPPRFWIGPLVSSDSLVRDPRLAATWKRVARDVVGVEMELTGVWTAAQHGGEGECRVLAIRGVSDIIGFQRRHSWTTYACSTAASFAYALVSSGLLCKASTPANH